MYIKNYSTFSQVSQFVLLCNWDGRICLGFVLNVRPRLWWKSTGRKVRVRTVHCCSFSRRKHFCKVSIYSVIEKYYWLTLIIWSYFYWTHRVILLLLLICYYYLIVLRSFYRISIDLAKNGYNWFPRIFQKGWTLLSNLNQ